MDEVQRHQGLLTRGHWATRSQAAVPIPKQPHCDVITGTQTPLGEKEGVGAEGGPETAGTTLMCSKADQSRAADVNPSGGRWPSVRAGPPPGTRGSRQKPRWIAGK